MKSFRIAIVGLGALGSEVCRSIAEEGYTDVLVIDPDRLERRNVTRSAIYQSIFSVLEEEAFHHFKSKLMAEFIERHYSLSWKQLGREIADVGMRDLATRDVILSCTDNTLARVETACLSRILGLPMIDGGVMSEGLAEGRASWFSAAPQSACYFCGLSEVRRAELIAYATSTSLGCGGLHDLSAMNGAVPAVQQTANSMLMILNQLQNSADAMPRSFSYRLKELAGKGWASERVEHPLSRSCPWHHLPDGEWIALDDDRRIGEALPQDGMTLQLLWPHCDQAYCRQCGYRSTPNRRVAWVRRRMACDRCGTVGVTEPIQTLATIGTDDKAANCTPRQLGIPSRHLYFLRHSFVPRTRKAINGPVA